MQPVAMNIYTFAKVTNIVERAEFGGFNMKGFRFCKGPILDFPTGSCYGPCNIALRYHAGM
jgi:hypothetical protein